MRHAHTSNTPITLPMASILARAIPDVTDHLCVFSILGTVTASAKRGGRSVHPERWPPLSSPFCFEFSEGASLTDLGLPFGSLTPLSLQLDISLTSSARATFTVFPSHRDHVTFPIESQSYRALLFRFEIRRSLFLAQRSALL
jgi:hypothetical protein